MVQPMVQPNFKNVATNPSQVKSSQVNPNQNNQETDTIVSGEQALEIQSVEIEKVDNRNPRVQRVIDIIDDEIKKSGYMPEKNAQDRRRASIIANRH